MCIPPIRTVVLASVAIALASPPTWAVDPPAAAEKGPETPAARVSALPSPPPIPEAKLVASLPTVPVRRGFPGFNVQMVDASLLPRDKQGIWVLDYAFKPIRMVTVETEKGRQQLHYMYYRVINHTGKPRMFVPQFILVTDKGKRTRYEDTVLPQAVEIIKAREDPTIRLLGAVNIMGMIPPSSKEGIDDAVYGVAIWEGVDPRADRLNVYVRGLSDGYQLVSPPDGGKPVARYKTLRIDFIRRGDERNLNEKEIQLMDPAYEWVYW